MSNRADLVRYYVDQGWLPFAYSGQFTPPTGWQHSSVDNATVDRISGSDNPVGLVLGKESGLVVVDIDPRNGGHSKAVLDHYGIGPKDTRVVSTASPGGYHLYFRYPEGVDRLQKLIDAGNRIGEPSLQGVDLLADGCHVLAPPTARVGHPDKPDGQYSLRIDSPVAELPKALLLDWQAAVGPAERPEGVPVGEIPSSEHEWALGLHRRNVEVAADAEQGTRDDVSYARICASMRIALALPDDVLSVVDVEADYVRACPYEIRDVTGKIDRAVSWAEKHQWVELERASKAGEVPDDVPEGMAKEYTDQLSRMKVRRAAQRVMEQERIEQEAQRNLLPDFEDGGTFLSDRINLPEWLIEGLLHHQGKAMLTAPLKAGKSTMMLGLVQALTTGSSFLGVFDVPKPLNVALFDLELGRAMAQRWLLDVDGIDPSKLHYTSLLGRGSSVDVRSATLRASIARRLRESEVDVLLVDPISPVLSALGVSENDSESVRPLLDAFDTLAVEAELSGLVITAHTGHADKARARGSSAFGDWPTALWNLQKDGEEQESPRTFAAFGRDVSVPRADLVFNPHTRSYVYQRNTFGVFDE